MKFAGSSSKDVLTTCPLFDLTPAAGISLETGNFWPFLTVAGIEVVQGGELFEAWCFGFSFQPRTLSS